VAEHPVETAAVRQRIETLVDGIRAMDLPQVMPHYAPDLVSFDLEPPLRHLGADAKHSNWMRAFTAYRPPLGYELCDLTITAGDDIAFTHALARISGTRTDGTPSDYWVRWTACLRKVDGTWLIVHDQISVPTHLPTSRAMLTLQP
jgi:ketosteroid isomerase-like protein